jgi:hypothetical protein
MRDRIYFDYFGFSIRDHIRCFLATYRGTNADVDVEIGLPSGLILQFYIDMVERTAYIGDLAVFEFTEDQVLERLIPSAYFSTPQLLTRKDSNTRPLTPPKT